MTRFWVWAAGLGACSGLPPPVTCQARVDLMVDWESARIHGLTSNDDTGEAVERVVNAAACANPVQLALVETHATLLAARLASKGATAHLLDLARKLGTLPLALTLRDAVGTATGSIPGRLARVVALGDSSWGPSPLAPHSTRARITHVTPHDSCVVVIPGSNAPQGTLMLGVARSGQPLDLHGDSPAVTWGSAHNPWVRLCTHSVWAAGDLLTGRINSDIVFQFMLQPTVEDEARGAALLALWGEDAVPPACAMAHQVDSLNACRWIAQVAP